MINFVGKCVILILSCFMEICTISNVKATPFYFFRKALQTPKRLFYQGNRVTLVHIWYILLYSIRFKLNLRL